VNPGKVKRVLPVPLVVFIDDRADSMSFVSPEKDDILSVIGVTVMTALAYPATRYSVSPIVDLASKPERERLSPSAIGAFFNIMECWRVKDEDAKQLLGGITNGPYYELKKDRKRVLDSDKLTRISYLVGIFKALNILHGKKLADEWMTLPNTNRIFGGLSPLAYMIKGGTPAMQTVRRLLDARRGGV
jgi:hypothetical protein